MSETSLAVGRPAVKGGDPAQPAPTGQGTGKTVVALVIGHDRAGAALLQTDQGRLTLASGGRHAVGTQLTLLMRADGSLRELAARPGTNGQPAPGGDLVRVGTLHSTGRQSLSLPAGATIRAEILHRFAMPPGQSVGDPTRLATDLKMGEVLVLRIHAATSTNGTEIASSRLPADFIAKVAAGGDQPRLSTPFGTLEPLPGSSKEPSQLTFRLLASPAPHGAAAAAPSVAESDPAILGKAWPDLARLLEHLLANDPAAAAALRKDLPRPGDGFVGEVLRFVLAMAADEPPETTLRHLFPQIAAQGDASQLADGLADDLQRYGRWAEAGGEWRTFVVPVADGERLAPFHLYVRDGDERNGTDPAEAGVRFMVDVDLSRLGAIQLDGLYRRRHLSLAVRSRRRLPRGFGEPLKQIFDRAMEAAGMTGDLRIEGEATLNGQPLGTLLGDRPAFPRMRA